jgi:hypothetical protein
MQCVTSDPNDLIVSDQEEGHQGTNSKQGHKDTYQNPPYLPSTIKVMKASTAMQHHPFQGYAAKWALA